MFFYWKKKDTDRCIKGLLINIFHAAAKWNHVSLIYCFNPRNILDWIKWILCKKNYLKRPGRLIRPYDQMRHVTCCEQFGLQLLPNSEECIFVTPERPF